MLVQSTALVADKDRQYLLAGAAIIVSKPYLLSGRLKRSVASCVGEFLKMPSLAQEPPLQRRAEVKPIERKQPI